MTEIHYGICNFCDSTCGLEIELDGKNILSIRGDRQDPFSRGHICPKGLAHKDLYAGQGVWGDEDREETLSRFPENGRAEHGSSRHS